MHGPDHPLVATVCSNMAVLYLFWEQPSGWRVTEAGGKPEEAEPLQLRALVIREKVFGLEHPEVAEACGVLGLVYQVSAPHSRGTSLTGKERGSTHRVVAPSCHAASRMDLDLERESDVSSVRFGVTCNV